MFGRNFRKAIVPCFLYLCKSLYLCVNFFKHFFIGNFSIKAEYNEYLSSVVFLKVLKSCFHSFRNRVISKV